MLAFENGNKKAPRFLQQTQKAWLLYETLQAAIVSALTVIFKLLRLT